MFVIPSVNRTNSILFPGVSQSGFRVKTSLNAEACDSAWLYDNGMYLRGVETLSSLVGGSILREGSLLINYTSSSAFIDECVEKRGTNKVSRSS